MTDRSRLIVVWDAWTRLFHWSFASAVLFLLLSGSTGFLFFDWHRLAGEFVLALIIFRLCWGILGSSNVRLNRLIQHPRQVASHLTSLFRRRVTDTRGHNAAGGWAIIIMLVSLTIQAATGMFIADEDELVEGAFYGTFSSATNDLLYTVHHVNAEFIIAFVSIHVVMILVYWLYAGKNLVLPMITGTMHWVSDSEPKEVFFQRWWVGLACFTVVIIALGYYLRWDRYWF